MLGRNIVKRGVRACTLDLIMDLVPNSEGLKVEQWKPPVRSETDEDTFLRIIGETFLQVGAFSENWDAKLAKRLRESAFFGGVDKKVDDASPRDDKYWLLGN